MNPSIPAGPFSFHSKADVKHAHSRRLQLPGAAALGSSSAVLPLRILSERAARRVGAAPRGSSSAPSGSASAVRLLRFLGAPRRVGATAPGSVRLPRYLGAPRPRCATPCRRDGTGLGVSSAIAAVPRCATPCRRDGTRLGAVAAVPGVRLLRILGDVARREGAAPRGTSSPRSLLRILGGTARCEGAAPRGSSSASLLELRVPHASRRRRSDAAAAKLLTPGSVWHWR